MSATKTSALLILLFINFAVGSIPNSVLADMVTDLLSMESHSFRTIWKDCGDSDALAEIKSVNFIGCQPSPHGCGLKKGSNVTANTDFIMKSGSVAVSAAKTRIHAIIAHFPVPWTPDNVNACKDCGLQCPLNPGSTNSYHLGLNIKKIYPCIKAVIKWEVYDATSGKDLFCFLAPIEVTN